MKLNMLTNATVVDDAIRFMIDRETQQYSIPQQMIWHIAQRIYRILYPDTTHKNCKQKSSLSVYRVF
jgi:hypothetical protein